jgi:hypothetical protein
VEKKNLKCVCERERERQRQTERERERERETYASGTPKTNPNELLTSTNLLIPEEWSHKTLQVISVLTPLHPILGWCGIFFLVSFNEQFFSLLNLVKYIRCTLPSFLFLLFLMALFSTPAW